MNRIPFLFSEVDNVTIKEAIMIAEDLILQKKPSYVVTPNADHIIRLEKNMELRKIYSEAGLILTDGMPLIWISRLMKTPIKERITGADFFHELCKIAEQKGFSIFLLGAAEGIAQLASENLKKEFPRIMISGTYSPPYNFESDEIEINKIINMIKTSKPDILGVGLGSPKQEKFIYKYLTEMDVPLSIAMGATIDFEADKIKRAPKWMQNHGFEWFFRFLMEPKRLFRRYFINDMKIFYLAVKTYFENRK